MKKEHRCYKVNSSNIEAIVFVDIVEKKIKTSCNNFELCYYSRVLVDGECPKYCEIISEVRKFAFRGRKPNLSIQEIEVTASKIKTPQLSFDQ
ncbi:MAG: hypothetical protein R6U44_04760 [Archaeoglobaceae archaeon]